MHMATHEALERARLEGALLMARTAAHHLNNTLVVVVGYTELLAHDPTVRTKPRLTKFARAAVAASLQAAEDLTGLQGIVRLEQDAAVALPLAVLDLDRSSQPPA